jgi:hypothetical protein
MWLDDKLIHRSTQTDTMCGGELDVKFTRMVRV